VKALGFLKARLFGRPDLGRPFQVCQENYSRTTPFRCSSCDNKLKLCASFGQCCQFSSKPAGAVLNTGDPHISTRNVQCHGSSLLLQKEQDRFLVIRHRIPDLVVAAEPPQQTRNGTDFPGGYTACQSPQKPPSSIKVLSWPRFSERGTAKPERKNLM
jgi:hypothetical protein